MNTLLIAPVVGLALLTVGGWALVQLLGQGGRMLLRVEAMEERLATRSLAPTENTPNHAPAPAFVPTAGRSGGTPPGGLSEALMLGVSTLTNQMSRGFCGKGAASTPLPIGQAAPPLVLPNLAGETVNLAEFRDSTTVVLFWHPGCGHCRRMLADLKAWEANPPEDAPRLIVVSMGTRDANEAMELRSPVVIDRGFVVARALGANGTPSAVLVDERGRIASPVVHGSAAVLALAGASAATKAVTV